MKLLDILVNKLDEWPEGMAFAMQDADREVKFSVPGPLPKYDDGIWFRNTGDGYTIGRIEVTAEDYNTTLVSREEWLSAKGKVDPDDIRAIRKRLDVIDTEIDKLKEERKSLEKKLAEEGLSAVDYDTTAKSPEGWKVGDLLTVIDTERDTHGFDIGSTVVMVEQSTNRGNPAVVCYRQGDAKRVTRWVLNTNLKKES